MGATNMKSPCTNMQVKLIEARSRLARKVHEQQVRRAILNESPDIARKDPELKELKEEITQIRESIKEIEAKMRPRSTTFDANVNKKKATIKKRSPNGGVKKRAAASLRALAKHCHDLNTGKVDLAVLATYCQSVNTSRLLGMASFAVQYGDAEKLAQHAKWCLKKSYVCKFPGCEETRYKMKRMDRHVQNRNCNGDPLCKICKIHNMCVKIPRKESNRCFKS